MHLQNVLDNGKNYSKKIDDFDVRKDNDSVGIIMTQFTAKVRRMMLSDRFFTISHKINWW